MEPIQQLLAILLVLGILSAVIWLMRSKGWARISNHIPGSRTKQLEVIDRIILTPQHSVHLVRVKERTFLVGISPASCCLLDSPELSASLNGSAPGALLPQSKSTQ